MPRSIAEIVVDLDSLTARDFDDAGARGLERLNEICDAMEAVNDPDACAPVMFRTMERLASVELFPLVRTLETWPGRYEKHLADSVRRKPTSLSVWMVDRILNARPPDAESWMALLRSVEENPAASAELKAEAAGCLEYQTRGLTNG